MDPEQPTSAAGSPAEQDKEAALFEAAPAIAKLLYQESKRVRRMVARKLWWQNNKGPKT